MIDTEQIMANNLPQVGEIQEVGSPTTPNKKSPENTAINSEMRLRKSSTVDRLTERRLAEKTYTATYFGSDFNYATQQEFRKDFKKNTLDKNLVDIGLIADEVNNPNDPGNNE